MCAHGRWALTLLSSRRAAPVAPSGGGAGSQQAGNGATAQTLDATYLLAVLLREILDHAVPTGWIARHR